MVWNFDFPVAIWIIVLIIESELFFFVQSIYPSNKKYLRMLTVFQKTVLVPQTPVAILSHSVPQIVIVDLVFKQIKHNPTNGPPWGLSAMEEQKLK